MRAAAQVMQSDILVFDVGADKTKWRKCAWFRSEWGKTQKDHRKTMVLLVAEGHYTTVRRPADGK